jgi:hypothetical protein
MYLVFSAFVSIPTSLLAAIEVSVSKCNYMSLCSKDIDYQRVHFLDPSVVSMLSPSRFTSSANSPTQIENMGYIFHLCQHNNEP